jgi:RNA polymerase sigma-70 factor (ECF subfamily)
VTPSRPQTLPSDTSFERLYRLHRRDVYGAVLRDVRNPDEAEDVTQTAFLNAFRAMRKGERPEKPRAWLVTIARNVIRRRYRELQRHPQEVALDPEVAATLMEVDGPTAGEITEAIRRIPPKQRAVILLREIQGRSYAEIAETLGLSLPAVETLIFRARRSLSEELQLVDQVPTTQRRKRGLFFLPLPGLGKLSLSLSLGRAGAAALVGSVAIVTVPITDSGVDRVRPPAVQRAPSLAEELGPPVSSPTALAPGTKTKPKARANPPRTSPAAANGKESDAAPGGEGDGGGVAGLPAVEPPPVVVPSPQSTPLPPLPVEPPPLPLPPLPEPPEPPPLALPPLPEPPPLPG